MAEKKECEKSQNIVDEASEKEKKESLNQEPEVSEETGSEEGGEEVEADEAVSRIGNFEGDYRENAEGLFAIDGRVR